MTADELELLKNSIDEVLLLDTKQGDHFTAQILFVFEGGETPDVFFNEVESREDGTFKPKGSHSVLLGDIASVRRLP